MHQGDNLSRTGLILILMTFLITLSLLITTPDSSEQGIETTFYKDHISFAKKVIIPDPKDNPKDHPKKPDNHKPDKNITTDPKKPDPKNPDQDPDNTHHDKPENKDHYHHSRVDIIPTSYKQISPDYKDFSIYDYDPQALLLKNQKQNLLTLYTTNSFFVKGGTVYKNNDKLNFLCRIKGNKFCFTRYLADSVDLIYAICPIYSHDQPSHWLYYQHHRNFLSYIRSIGIKAVTIEGIYKGQSYIATQENNFPWDMRVELSENIYLRENLLNVAARKIKEWEYLAWIDAHQIFLDTYFFEDALWAAEHHDGVQMFQYLEHLDEGFNRSIAWFNLGSTQYAYMVADPPYKWPDMAKGVWNGNAFIIRRELYEQIGYILDTCIAGCCDCAYNIACFQKWYDWYLQSFPNYRYQLLPWIENAWKYFKKKPKALRGRMFHFYHPILFNWGEYLKKVSEMQYSLQDELYRDDDFVLHIKDGTRLAAMFPR